MLDDCVEPLVHVAPVDERSEGDRGDVARKGGELDERGRFLAHLFRILLFLVGGD
jgi:hypothetical protein